MVARSESWYRLGEARRAAGALLAGMALFTVAWTLLHTAFYDDYVIVDTPVYQRYGDAMLDGQVPYRDFELEYPPGALPVFALPALGPEESYHGLFELTMLACGLAMVAAVVLALDALDAPTRRLVAAIAFLGLAPLAIGSVILSRYDLWPAALCAAALALLAAGRERLGLGVVAVAAASKVYPLVVLPLALVYVARRRGLREALLALAVFVAVLVAILAPFALVAPDGLLASFERQTARPLQIESLGSSILLAAHQLALYAPTVVSSFGSQNLGGPLPDLLATVQTGVQALAIAAVVVVFARREADPDRLFAASAAAAAAFIAFAKVLSPQFLIWLLPLVPLVAGTAGVAAAALLTAALVLTQLWFPKSYWEVVELEATGWLVLLRDLVLVALFALLLAAVSRMPRGRTRTG